VINDGSHIVDFDRYQKGRRRVILDGCPFRRELVRDNVDVVCILYYSFFGFRIALELSQSIATAVF